MSTVKQIQIISPTAVSIILVGVQGPAGPAGASGSATQVVGEVPSGTINGANATFTSQYPFIPESVAVFHNGVMQKKVDDFNTSGTQTIIMAVSPEAGTRVLINYLRA